MYKYVYVTMENEIIIAAEFTQHMTIINEYAQIGYRYVGYIPTKINSYGVFNKIDLIFELLEK